MRNSLTENIRSAGERIYRRLADIWAYCSDGVWEDHRTTVKVNVIKTISLTVKTFLNSDLQSKACAMTYRTLLAVVPALALVFAIGRGFGFQNLLQSQLFSYFPSQHRALEMAFSFVDSCLAQASEGLFVGVGIVFLFWTIVSLLDSVEDAFNQVWGVTAGRSLFRKVSDYLAICIILPVLMICSGGLQIFMSAAIQKLLPSDFVSPLTELFLDCISILFAWLFFTGAYMLIPNAKVKFKNAFPAGIVAGTAFQLLQWLFVTGQLYVSKYNAIYGSFSFLPLMMIWMQLSWLITLAGALICRSAQNISLFSYNRQIRSISMNYSLKVTVSVLTVILKRFSSGQPPLTPSEISDRYDIPSLLASSIIGRLIRCGLLVRIAPQDKREIPDELPVQPALSTDRYTMAYVVETLRDHGESDFIPGLGNRFQKIVNLCDSIRTHFASAEGKVLLIDL